MQERYFPNPPTFFRNASDIVNKCKSGVSRTRRLAIAFHLFPTGVYQDLLAPADHHWAFRRVEFELPGRPRRVRRALRGEEGTLVLSWDDAGIAAPVMVRLRLASWSCDIPGIPVISGECIFCGALRDWEALRVEVVARG